MKSLEERVIKKIDSMKMKPLPRSRFIIKNILFLIGFLIFFFVGAISISVIFYVLTDGAEFYEINNSLFVFLNVIPYFWLIITLIFLSIAYFNSKKIDNSYRYLTLKNVLLTLLMCLFFGIILHSIGIASIIEEGLASTSSIYNDVIYNRKKIFHRPEDGALVGKIVNFTITMEKRELNLQDVEDKLWTILLTDDTIFKSRIDIKNGVYINVFGKDEGYGVFTAKIIKEIPICCATQLGY